MITDLSLNAKIACSLAGIILLIASMFGGFLFQSAPALAVTDCTNPDPNVCVPRNTSQDEASCQTGSEASDTSGCGFIQKYVSPAITFLTIGMGVIVTIMIIVGGIQYSTAGGDAQKVAAAKSRIFNAIFALVAFALLWAFLQFIVPGGVF